MIREYKKFRENLKIAGLTLINFVNLNDSEKALVLAWRNHKDVRNQMFTNHVLTQEEHSDFIKKLAKNQTHFCWLAKKDKKSIGVVALHDVDFKNRHCYFGAYADPHGKNIGVGFVLFQTIIKLAFDVFKLHSLRGSTIGDNPVLYIHKKLGFKEVGRYNDYVFRNGGWRDAVVTEIINKNDYV
ncbi:UDP-4-amino-4,6-dideoxy-N-acetyl-beta-L-altrosamine N-acetyltransferase [Candidatus Giovannonibacteria bacterium RIFCSPLOWO2_12_FULL_44_25]|uniref:UDP-4-amino-4, 6-dideoxy-N-acetyl-beta-L-altrosamine N-acetyltransferase n=2 Tax=Candidatus Giovannoniibacteriota TaxID=1752738 RepID=A0A1F5WAH7_9BACT|nr:MAG: Pseudaminic acid biosynthesis N-acetyl transferase [Parcubacteria group bacterium GW2011_GWC1_44_10]KKT60389.1 MAG: Pseudaminic acid biosynthesis N-acetyl transferase [Candidatus Giovannonibacteria bacterium GW2011_GWA1_44_25]KKU30247.1 MAG: Pseudaminic acid biosynthesis N-acetyl transferase [Candidatus Giovannonibacteria bacterium GW2011_GWB1_46_20]OGF50455.1 MAG: UDP-4-amino-4,6-dideoxy-N-acetyl-beta-L-altrosamine N-acetyltransferase [Candidatus Giovannonibacteria bacterium GWA2_45_15]